jgi:hypothetical protein
MNKALRNRLGRAISWIIYLTLPVLMQYTDWTDDDGRTADFDMHFTNYLTVSIHEFSIPLAGKLGCVDIRWGAHFDQQTWHTFEYA